jgi:hypothetical protein
MMSRWYKQTSATGQRTENTKKLRSCKEGTPAKLARAEFEQEKITTFSITSSPHKIKHVRFHQHSETVSDGRPCRWAEASQVTEVFHSNPDRNTQCEDLPNSVEHPNHWNQKQGIPPIEITAHIDAREYALLWCLSNELCSPSQQAKLTYYNILESYCREYSTGDVNSQEDNNKEDEHGSGSLIHGM